MKNSFDHRYYNINKFFLTRLGIWPEQSFFIRCILPAVYVLTLLTLVIANLLRMYDMWGHTSIIMEALSPILVIIVVGTQLLNSSFNVQKMREILDRIKDHWTQMNNSPNVDILHKHGQRGRLITLTYTIYIFSSMMLFLILPVLPAILDVINPLNESRPKQLLFQTEYRVDHNKYFYEILAHGYMISLLTMAIIVAVDTLYFTVVEHACGLFEMVGANMKLMNFSNDRNDIDDYKNICYCIELHKEALRFAELVESNYTISFMCIISLSLLIMSISGVQVVLSLGNVRDMMRFGVFVVAQVFHILFNSIPGQMIIDHSLEVHDFVYDSDWIHFSIRNKKLLMVILMRSQKPCFLSAGKIYICSMASFSSVMQTAGSYFTVLTSML